MNDEMLDRQQALYFQDSATNIELQLKGQQANPQTFERVLKKLSQLNQNIIPHLTDQFSENRALQAGIKEAKVKMPALIEALQHLKNILASKPTTSHTLTL